MGSFKIQRMAGIGVDPYEEHIEVNGKKIVVAFDKDGHATTTDEDVAEYYRNRNFPNSFPDGRQPSYWVSENDNNLFVE